MILFTWFPELTEGQDINPPNESKMRNEVIEGGGTRCSDSTDWAEKGAGNMSPRPVVWKKDVEYVAKRCKETFPVEEAKKVQHLPSIQTL